MRERNKITRLTTALITTMGLLMIIPTFSYGKKLADLPELVKPSAMNMNDSHLYVCDRAEVKIYSRRDFKFIKKFGKQGEGPQEFKLQQGGEGLMVFPHKDVLVVSSVGKVSIYKQDGTFVREMRSGVSQAGGGYQILGDKYVGIGTSMSRDLTMNFTINIHDEKLTKLKEIYSQVFMDQGKMTFPMVYPIFVVEGGLIYTPGGNEFHVNIFNGDGKKTGEIKREYKQLKVTSDYSKSIHHYFKTNPATKAVYEVFFKKNLAFRDYFPAIQFFDVDNGKIYFITYLKEDGKYEMFVYNKKGTFIKRIFIPFYFRNAIQPGALKFKDGCFYNLVENDEEEVWELHKFKVD